MRHRSVAPSPAAAAAAAAATDNVRGVLARMQGLGAMPPAVAAAKAVRLAAPATEINYG